jgi:hypothetical protein
MTFSSAVTLAPSPIIWSNTVDQRLCEKLELKTMDAEWQVETPHRSVINAFISASVMVAAVVGVSVAGAAVAGADVAFEHAETSIKTTTNNDRPAKSDFFILDGPPNIVDFT